MQSSAITLWRTGNRASGNSVEAEMREAGPIRRIQNRIIAAGYRRFWRLRSKLANFKMLKFVVANGK
jgi:hypothetical protein